ncbi:MAG: biopolymer transporter ExbD [Lentisphaeria bacterium]
MKKRNNDSMAVPMSSMIDVVFLLLIYFIVTQKSEISEAHLAVNLPSPGRSSKDTTKPQLLELEVHTNALYLQGRHLSDEDVSAFLINMGKQNPDMTVMIKVSMSARAKDLVKALDYCSGANLTNMNVVTLK